MPWTGLATLFLAVSGVYGSRLDTSGFQECKSRQNLSSTAVHNLLQSVPDAEKIRESVRYYTNGSHVAGQGLQQALWTQELWDAIGLPNTSVKSYSTNLTLNDEHRVALLDTAREGDPVVYEAPLIEDNAPKAGDGQPPFIPAFFGCAGEGNVTAQYIFANFGTQEDYDDLVGAGINITGKIALVKSTYESAVLKKYNLPYHRATQESVATKRGLAGMLIYPDPQMDGEIIVENGYQPFPDGPARPPSLIERGNVGICSLDEIPAMPISYADAIPMLQALNGHGPLAADFNDRWQGGGLTSHNVTYNVGPSPENVVLNVINKARHWVGPIHDVIGTIPGCAFPEEVIVLGNHRDAWGPGAGDGNSGSAALNEVARSLVTALKKGWQPLRTIILASWEGEEVGQVGSRPWLNENKSQLNGSVAAYLNVVIAGAGTKFHAQGSPLLAQAMHNATGQVQAPTKEGSSVQTVLEAWGDELGLGSGGDAMPFQEYAFSVADFGFSRGPKDAVFPYHSLFDTYSWMEQYGDPGFEHHLATTKIWLQLATSLADEAILPYRVQAYTSVFQDGLESLSSTANLSSHLDLSSLKAVVDDFAKASAAFDAHSDSLADQVQQQHPLNDSLLAQVQSVNHVYTNFERLLGDPDLPLGDRDYHLIIQPAPYYFQTKPFPGLTKAIAAGDWTLAAAYRDKIVDQLNKAVAFLQ
ncbi:glutamate carboxypeptidase [Aspergillus nomiae NRRL 13137]|uniref:Glutamate carboxypeptidase n=1 Tax=Aspergillus nomiae NRRL (strain ATCC 15546 / NRRL 13137 / CBS 260.88 / M93) TaxID=1509407 RepID=A0A0L1IQS5_ASPN3|nr:glutamate carboxypeptidase [Aspergillus nomiae NRRL 13137]KNG81740.1 glutamate carboxypeptidase [Aspergillus nomiae NRRL 13137]